MVRGLSGVVLKELGTFRFNHKFDDGRIVNQFERIFLVKVPHDIKLVPDKEELAELKWFTASELKEKIVEMPEMFTPVLRYALNRFFPYFV